MGRKYITKTFTKEYLMEELDLPDNAIEDKIIDTTRWSVLHDIIFKDKDGKHYSGNYSCGATEQQDESPWEYDKEVVCVEVEEKIVQRKEWIGKEIK